jgi:Ni/Co efflux regulator RcnB
MEINGYPDYLIYDDGRIWSKPRKDSRGHQMKGRFLKHGKNNRGYHQVCLCRDGKTNNFLVSRLVALHYIANPENKAQVDHINRDKDNNHISNLRWATEQENQDNRGMRTDNKSGHKYISYHKARKLWSFEYRRKGHNVRIYFKTKTEALCAKFAFLVLIRARNEYSDVSF